MKKEESQESYINRVTTIWLDHKLRSQQTRESLASEHYRPEQIITRSWNDLKHLSTTPFRVIGQKLTKNQPLTFGEAFLGMAYVVSATNRSIYNELYPMFDEAHNTTCTQEQLLAPAQTFLTAMAQRSMKLTPDEIAGMVAASMMDVVLRLGFMPSILEIGGMGGDKGILIDGKNQKVMNASTLSAIVLSAMGIPTLKHGGGANTSRLGATEAIEELGVNIYQDSQRRIHDFFDQTNFYFSNTHIVKTFHDLSHSIFGRYEMITHLIGPMTLPIGNDTRLNKVFGINDSVDPIAVCKSFELLHQKRYFNVGNIVAVSGLGPGYRNNIDAYDIEGLRPYMCLDEVSPFKTLLGIVRDGVYIGNYIIDASDFGVELDGLAFLHNNDRTALLNANKLALSKIGSSLHPYLAMNAAVGLLCSEYLDRSDSIIGNKLNPRYIKESFRSCMIVLENGDVERHLEKIKARSLI